MWTTSPHCEDVIQAKWDMSHLGSPMFQLVQKLKACKFSLKEWSKTAFGNNKTRISQLQSELKVFQADSASEGNLLLQNEVKSELATVMLREEMFLHQRSRVRWLSHGDKNSAFFHATMIQRRQRNQILQL
ncbi:hypothetical protein ACSBR2_019994 [Camellia fascicularis]